MNANLVTATRATRLNYILIMESKQKVQDIFFNYLRDEDKKRFRRNSGYLPPNL